MEKLYNYILQKESDIGLLRESNEDSVLALVHPEDDSLKILAVADGMGGKEYGDVCSNYVTRKFGEWFLEKNKEFFLNPLKIRDELLKLTYECNDYFISFFGKNIVGTTLTLAIILNKETIILHLGDSRCYFYKDNILTQVTEDDSDVWLYHKFQGIKKEWLRYFSSSNIINNCIGISKDSCKPHIYIYSNDEYNTLLLTTDGVTDLVMDNKIRSILGQDIKRASKVLINEAVNVDQHLFIPSELKNYSYDYYLVPVRGRDNASVVLFSKI